MIPRSRARSTAPSTSTGSSRGAATPRSAARSSTPRPASTSSRSTPRCRSRCSVARRLRPQDSMAESATRGRDRRAASSTRRCARRAASSTPKAIADGAGEPGARSSPLELAVERTYTDAVVAPLPSPSSAPKSTCSGRWHPMYEVFGADDGSGLVILSDDPVDFHPVGQDRQRRVRAVARRRARVRERRDADHRHLPASRARPTTATCSSARGMQRIVPLGEVIDVVPGVPHDGFLPLHRFMRWLVDDC